MFKAVLETDKYGNPQTRFYLTQGDSCVIRCKPKSDGQPLPLTDVEKCLFKLSDLDYNEEFVKELVAEDDRFVLRLSTNETKNFSIDSHIYEFEYTLIGGAVQTPNQWRFEVTDQITE